MDALQANKDEMKVRLISCALNLLHVLLFVAECARDRG
jgi:hypothetical protein